MYAISIARACDFAGVRPIREFICRAGVVCVCQPSCCIVITVDIQIKYMCFLNVFKWDASARRSVLLLADDAGRHDSRVLVNNTIITTCTYSSACQLRAELKWPMLINLECICTARALGGKSPFSAAGSHREPRHGEKIPPARGACWINFNSCFFRLTSGAQIKSSLRWKNRAPSRMLKWRLPRNKMGALEIFSALIYENQCRARMQTEIFAFPRQYLLNENIFAIRALIKSYRTVMTSRAAEMI